MCDFACPGSIVIVISALHDPRVADLESRDLSFHAGFNLPNLL